PQTHLYIASTRIPPFRMRSGDVSKFVTLLRVLPKKMGQQSWVPNDVRVRLVVGLSAPRVNDLSPAHSQPCVDHLAPIFIVSGCRRPRHDDSLAERAKAARGDGRAPSGWGQGRRRSHALECLALAITDLQHADPEFLGDLHYVFDELKKREAETRRSSSPR